MFRSGEEPKWSAIHEKKQLSKRQPQDLIKRILCDFNEQRLSAAEAGEQLGVSRTRLYELRSAYLRAKKVFCPGVSGGAHRPHWPADVDGFLKKFLPLQRPPNYQLVADEIEREFGFRRARSTVEAYVKEHHAALIPANPPKNRPYRRFRRAHFGELWQHDSSLHQWWPGARKQVLLLTVDDCTGMNLAGSFVDSDTTWNHFCHFRKAFEQWGLPQLIYTDGLSLFGASSPDDLLDPVSEFQRALFGLNVGHRVAPTPQAKGKIERRFSTFQKRMVTLLAYAGVTESTQAQEILQMEMDRQNRTKCRSTGKIPLVLWEQQSEAKRTAITPCPDKSLLDLHFSIRCKRRINNDRTIDFLGQNYPISPTARKSVTIAHHPKQRFWVLDSPPTASWPTVLGHFTL